MEINKVIDFARFGNETTEHALAAMVEGTNVTAKLLREVGDAGHPEAELTGETGEVNALLLSMGYLLDEEPSYPLVEEPDLTPKKYIFKVRHNVVRHQTVELTSTSLAQATSNMLAHMLDLGLEVRADWTVEEDA